MLQGVKKPAWCAYAHAYFIRLISTKSISGLPTLRQGQADRPALVPARVHRAAEARAAMSGSTRHPANRLASEDSPYLLQHAHNPVDWFPWGQEAFDRARQQDKPIFLSIGYSTCHWCHVMERESFEDEDIAAILNEYYVSIKVDREERPDVDKIYMSYIQATQGGGGWPMSVFLTPELNPFFGGTYFPKDDAYGRPGFKSVLRRIADVWKERKSDIRAASDDAMRQLGEILSAGNVGSEQQSSLDDAIVSCAQALADRFDPEHGGFGPAPKFPRPSELFLMMTYYVRQVGAASDAADPRLALHMATFTLGAMQSGGISDHVGGGMSRYSVDEFWHVPHFEKMLYDQAQLVQAYVAAFQVTGNREDAFAARRILDYILRDLRHPQGGFFAAEDADSLDPEDGKKKEGHFYVWTEQEIDAALAPEELRLFKAHYGVKSDGNCTLSPRSDPHGEFKGKNVLIAVQPLTRTASGTGLSIGQVEEILAEAREKLFRIREKRPRPHRDEKIVAAWNGMAIGAFAVAGRVLMNEDPPIERCFPVEGVHPRIYIEAAEIAADFVRNTLWDGVAKRLRRSFMQKTPVIGAFSDDYAHLISGLLDLYASTGAVKHLMWASELQEVLDEEFWDVEGGGYFQTGRTSGNVGSIKLRLKEDYDGAEPAASSIAASNLWRLAALSGTERAKLLRARAERCCLAFIERLTTAPVALPQLCCASHLVSVGHARQVVLVGRRGADDTNALLDAALSVFAPDKAVIHIDLEDIKEVQFWKESNPEALALAEATGLTARDPATAFICQNFTCRAPTTDPATVARTLNMPRQVSAGNVVRPTQVKLPFGK